jgi:LemA protein
MEPIFFLIIIVILPILILGGMYNGLVSKRNLVRSAFSTIDVMLKKRHDLIPNLVETVKAFAAHERATFEKVIELRNRASAPDISTGERMKLEGQIGPQIGRLLAIGEAYPQLKSSDQFLNLQRNLTEIEEQISAARRAYNGAVLAINNAVESFPTNLLAAQFGFTRQDFFEGDDSARESMSIKL